MSQQQQRGGRGRGRGGPGGRGGRGGSSGSPAPSVGGTEYSTRSTAPGGGGSDRGRPPHGGGPAAPRGGPPGGGFGGARGGGGGGRGGGAFRGGAPGVDPATVFAAGQPARESAHLAGLDQLVRSLSQLKVRDEMPLRPGWGTLGRAGTLRTNFFAITLPANKTWYEYDVAFAPEKDAKGDRRGRILDLLEANPQYAPYVPHIAHDRSNRLVSAKKLPQPFEFVVPFLDVGQETPSPRALTFTVTIKQTSEHTTASLVKYMDGRPENRDLDTKPIVNAANLVIQQYAAKKGFRVGRNRYFFPAETERHTLSLGIEACRGFFMSVRPMYKQLMLNVNVCMTAFYVPGNLAQAMDVFQRQTGGGLPRAFVERLKVTTKHLGYIRTYTVRAVSNVTAQQAMFDCQELGGRVSVAEYFKRKYKITLKRANDLPLINVGTAQKPNLLPPEVCEIPPGLPFRGKLDADQTAAMINYACNPPIINGQAIVDQGFNLLGLRPDAQSSLAAFGLGVSNEMTVIPYRLLPPPSVSYKQGRPPNIKDAGWNILDVKFHSGGRMSSWAVLLVQEGRRDEFQNERDPELTTFLQTFLRKCSSSGIVGADKPPKIMSVKLPSPGRGEANDPNRLRALDAIRQTFRQHLDPKAKPSFTLVLLSGVDKFIRAGVKKIGDCELGLHTVCMLLKKARDNRPNRQDQYFSNVVLKVNAKLGGMNHLLDAGSMQWLLEEKTMVMGVDVTHPSPNSAPGTPSIAAVVGSVDDHFVQFPASLALQKPDWNKESKEMVENLTKMTIERLQAYQKKSGRLPARVFVYRDGVSEGQYEQVLRHELPKLQAAFKQISTKTPYKPKLTIAICGKRHHARFWGTIPAAVTRNGNTLPGTVVDKAVTEIYGFDFYLQAHNGLQGHVKATHYSIVYDEVHHSADKMQQGTHTASYLYARATKAVSLAPAAYYADIAAERGRDYLNVFLNTAEDRSSVGGRSKTTAEKEAEKERMFQEALKMWGNGVHSDLRDSMFYI